MSATTLDRPRARGEGPSDPEVQAHLKTGLRNRWYPVLPSRFVEISGKPLGITRLGERIVLWRDATGVVRVQSDRCPHRAVPLSKGMNEGDRIRCAYHGVEIGADGTVLAVPGQPGCALEGKKAVKTYPSFELAEAIWVWFGDALHAEAPPFNPPEQLAGGEFSTFCCYADWRASWRYIYDNLMDPMHGAFLHANSHSMSQGETSARFVTRDTEKGFFFEKDGQRNVNFDWSEFLDDGALMVRLEIPYPRTGGPGGNFGIVSVITPIDETNSACFFWRFRKVQGWVRDTWRFLYRTKLEPRHWHVLEQDREMLDGVGLGLERGEMLYQHDAGLMRLRRYLARQARLQMVALHEAGVG
ncbi:Rieske 2Fe-2S domain-containing protein [Roseomonas sp. CCTCC AB2023176]|uniref:Rieske 2Fe-2S domain-containing protein n=1 Tax=Roseomonas sp. CCTCC AB2023176 TaxID=3342640 RepID=UPI0035E174CF